MSRVLIELNEVGFGRVTYRGVEIPCMSVTLDSAPGELTRATLTVGANVRVESEGSETVVRLLDPVTGEVLRTFTADEWDVYMEGK